MLTLDNLLTVKDLMKILNISRSKAYSLVNDTSFPTVKFGKCIRISEKGLNLWLKNKMNVV